MAGLSYYSLGRVFVSTAFESACHGFEARVLATYRAQGSRSRDLLDLSGVG